MTDVKDKDFIVIVQCDIVKERCSGVYCERAFHERSGGFAGLPKDRAYRTLNMTCGGCCGRALHRKLTHLARKLKKEDIKKKQILVQLSSCITNDNYHGPPCPHLDYLRTLIARTGLDVRDGTKVSAKSEERRAAGEYASGQ